MSTGHYAVTMVTSSGATTLAAQRYGDDLRAVSVVLSGLDGWSIAQAFDLDPATGRLALRGMRHGLRVQPHE
jgi:hypothetical protein